MINLRPRYSPEVHARLGAAAYERVRTQVEAGIHGRIVAVDVDSGAFAVADDSLTAAQQVLADHPAAQVWCVRIGRPAVHRRHGLRSAYPKW